MKDELANINKLRDIVSWASYKNETDFNNKTIPQIIKMYEKAPDKVIE